LRRPPARAETVALLGITTAGLTLFVAPLLVGSAFPEQAALFTALIATSALAVLALALQTQRLSSRLLAVLAALVAVDATLRLVIVIGLLGFSPIFFLIIASGYVMGPSFGFALGALTLLLSAVLTAGFGPWLPYQMLASGWVGLGAGYLGTLMGTRASTPTLPHKRGKGRPGAIVVLAIYGCLAGLAYGVLLDLWEWPFLLGVGSSPISWAPGLSLVDLARRFTAFYVTTSLVYDSFRAAGNVVLIALLGPAVIRALDRFRHRFLVEWAEPEPVMEPAPAKISADVGTSA
jgi:energy-coupling factor transport system substrate-specific component